MVDAVKKLRKFAPDLNGFREDQRRLYEVILRAIEAGEKEIGVYYHIRGGKSMLQRMLSVTTAELNLCSVSIAINNRTELRRQIVSEEKWLEDFDRLNTIAPRTTRHGFAHVRHKNNGEELSGYWPVIPWPNSEYLLSTTIQTICHRVDKVIEWIESINNNTGLPVLIHLDECQNFGIDDTGGVDIESRDWSPVIQRIQSETNVILLALSGYPHREDGLCLPGFIEHGKTDEEREKWVRGKVLMVIDEKRALTELNLLRYTKQSFTMAPKGGSDFIVGMERGFENNTLCALHHWKISHKITYEEDGVILLDNQSLAEVEEFYRASHASDVRLG